MSDAVLSTRPVLLPLTTLSSFLFSYPSLSLSFHAFSSREMKFSFSFVLLCFHLAVVHRFYVVELFQARMKLLRSLERSGIRRIMRTVGFKRGDTWGYIEYIYIFYHCEAVSLAGKDRFWCVYIQWWFDRSRINEELNIREFRLDRFDVESFQFWLSCFDKITIANNGCADRLADSYE